MEETWKLPKEPFDNLVARGASLEEMADHMILLMDSPIVPNIWPIPGLHDTIMKRIKPEQLQRYRDNYNRVLEQRKKFEANLAKRLAEREAREQAEQGANN